MEKAVPTQRAYYSKRSGLPEDHDDAQVEEYILDPPQQTDLVVYYNGTGMKWVHMYDRQGYPKTTPGDYQAALWYQINNTVIT